MHHHFASATSDTTIGSAYPIYSGQRDLSGKMKTSACAFPTPSWYRKSSSTTIQDTDSHENQRAAQATTTTNQMYTGNYIEIHHVEAVPPLVESWSTRAVPALVTMAPGCPQAYNPKTTHAAAGSSYEKSISVFFTLFD